MRLAKALGFRIWPGSKYEPLVRRSISQSEPMPIIHLSIEVAKPESRLVPSSLFLAPEANGM